MAGPGTGKSRALKYRVRRLIEEGQNPTRVLAVTFTRNAAENLKKLVTHDTNDQNVRAGTLHSYCFSILKRADVFQFTNRTPRSLVAFSRVPFELSMLIHDLVRTQKFGGKTSCRKRILAFEAAWARLQSNKPGWPEDSIDEMFNNHLLAWLRFHRAMLIGELVPVTLHFLYKNPASDIFTAFDHIVVDEYQDLNRAEQEIIDLLAPKSALAIVGDADQSIYRFRYANPNGIEDFKTRHPETHDESLIECKRCPIRIVEIANQLIRKNHQLDTSPCLHAAPDNINGKIHIIQWKNQNEEAEGIAKYVDYLLNGGNYERKEILILTPRRKMAYKIRDSIEIKGIPIHSFYQEEALEKESAQRAFSLLTLLDDKEDRVALRWWLGCDSPTGFRGQYQKLREYCEQESKSPWDALEAIRQGKLVLQSTSRLSEPFNELCNRIAHLSTLSLRELIDNLLPEDNDDCSVLREIAECGLAGSKDIHQLFDHIRTSITQPEIQGADFVQIMSPQKAKGLSSKVVIVTGCSNGLLPSIDDTLSDREKEDDMREQRRLFYVAITRCSEVLVLSSFLTLKIGDAYNMGIKFHPRGRFWARSIASDFIDDLGSTAPRSQNGSEWQESGYKEIEQAI